MNEINIKQLLGFLNASPTPFHASAQITQRLERAGYQQLSEADIWQLKPGRRYWVTRNDSSVIGFRLPKQPQAGLTLIGAHTDSPCLKLKPSPNKISEGFYQTGVEVYGGALLNPWFDRDLSLAGRISYTDKQGQLTSQLIDLEHAIATIPSLAIHLNRDVNKQHRIDAQLHLPPLWFQADEDVPEFRKLLKQLLIDSGFDQQINDILDFDLYYYDTQAPAVIGLKDEFIASARLDNLLSCYIGLQALIDSENNQGALLVCTDHEEVGSQSACGANGPFLRNILERIGQTTQDTQRLIHKSRLISVDNAHGIHPNYADKHDPQHKPKLNHGPTIKVNANQRYATNSETAAWFRQVCQKNEIPVQSVAVRSDMACGSTIGPITASQIGIKTVDVGIAQLAMHSIRELAGTADVQHLYKALVAVINSH